MTTEHWLITFEATLIAIIMFQVLIIYAIACAGVAIVKEIKLATEYRKVMFDARTEYDKAIHDDITKNIKLLVFLIQEVNKIGKQS